jgi:phenylacetate-CoA ligase
MEMKRDGRFRYVDEIKKFNSLTIENISEFQLGRLRAICQYANDHCGYYRDLFTKNKINDFGRLELDSFKEIPILTKDTIRADTKSLLSNEWPQDKLRKTATGGTISSPVPFYSDWDSYFKKNAATIVFDQWLGYTPGLKAAFLWQARQDFSFSNPSESSLSNLMLYRELYLPCAPLDDSIMYSYFDLLKKFSPVLLQAYPGPLEIFSRFLVQNNLKLSIPAISCTAECLLPYQSDLVQEAFGKRPVNCYCAREAGRLATECYLHGGMHINAYCLYIEIMEDESNGGVGPILVTDLWNLGMPLIRYKIGDLGSITYEKCACGSQLPRLTEIVGREVDLFVNSKGQKIPGVSFPNRIIKECAEIEQMQIIQKGYRQFQAMIKPGPAFSDETRKRLGTSLDGFMSDRCELEVILVDEIPLEKSGKVRFCKNTMNLSNS